MIAISEVWLATIDGHEHLRCDFIMPAGLIEGQARMRAWTIWSHARGGSISDPAHPVAAFGLRVERVK